MFAIYNEATGKYLNPVSYTENKLGEIVYPEVKNVEDTMYFNTFEEAATIAEEACCSNMMYDEIFVKEI